MPQGGMDPIPDSMKDLTMQQWADPSPRLAMIQSLVPNGKKYKTVERLHKFLPQFCVDEHPGA